MEWMMEWVETTGKTVDEAKELALDQLGVVADDAEFEVLAEPKQGLFGRVRGEARVRARVRPTPVRPKQERRRGRKGAGGAAVEASADADVAAADDEPQGAVSTPPAGSSSKSRLRGGRASSTPAA